jgi:hypothetical protein
MASRLSAQACTHVSAALGKNLILDVHPRRAHGDEAFRDPGGVDGVAAARVGVHHHRHGRRLNDVPRGVENVLHLHQTHVGFGEQRSGNAEARDLYRLETGVGNELGAQRVVAARNHDRAARHDGLAQAGGFFHVTILLKRFGRRTGIVVEAGASRQPG